MTNIRSQGPRSTPRYAAFSGQNRIAAGTLAEVAVMVRQRLEEDPNASVLTFDRETAQVVDLDLRGSDQDVAARYASADTPDPSAQKRGRPKLGVVPREVTLLPRHWDWLAQQPGGASITLRKLVEAAQKSDGAAARVRQEMAYRFMATMAGDLANFEEAARALFANDLTRVATLVSQWPTDVAAELMFHAKGAEP